MARLYAVLSICVLGDQLLSLHSSTTPYIDNRPRFNRFQDQQSPVALYKSTLCNNTQTSGYLQVPGGDELFFILFEAEDADPYTPVSLWVNGGPGSSSLLGAFNGIGPCRIDETGKKAVPNPFSWTKHTHLLILDQVKRQHLS